MAVKGWEGTVVMSIEDLLAILALAPPGVVKDFAEKLIEEKDKRKERSKR